MNPLIWETPFGVNIDLSLWQEIFSLPTNDLIAALMAIFGWLIIALIFFFMGAELWVNYRESRYSSRWKWMLLAVDIPPLFVQSPKAVEQIFAHLSGARINPNIGEKYWIGKKKKFFSIEIISIEGYIQFLIRTEAEFRDLVEAAVYAQYPEAEITEVEDYVNNIPSVYPNNEYDVFGIEFKLAEDSAYPIRTYQNFEYSISKDAVFSDPMAAILENFSRIGHGENIWMQIIVEPAGNAWKEKGIALVKKIIENKKAEAHGFFGSLFTGLFNMIADEAGNIWNWNFEPKEKEKPKESPLGRVLDLTPGTRTTVEAVEEKISKLGFKTKIRALYAARKDVYSPHRCIDGLVGAMNQFHIMNRNAIVPYAVTKAHYAFKNTFAGWKKTTFVSAFKKRKLKKGTTAYILNIEELATIWHFPLPFVKTPLVQKAAVKRGEPPINLPVEITENPLKPLTEKKKEEESLPPLPPELPYA